MCCVCNMNTEQARVMLIEKMKIIQEQKEHSGFIRIEPLLHKNYQEHRRGLKKMLVSEEAKTR